MTTKASSAGSRENPSSAKATGYQRPGPDDPEPGGSDQTPDPSADSLEAKQQKLLSLQVQEKSLTAEIARLRTFQTEQSAFAAQVQANNSALSKEILDLTTFVTNEKKGLPPAAATAVLAAKAAVNKSIDDAKSTYEQAVAKLKADTQALEGSARDVADAEAAYATQKQAPAERKRVLGEVKSLRKSMQDAQAQGEIEKAGFWLLEMEDRLKNPPEPDAAKLASAWSDLEQKRQSLDNAAAELDQAKTALAITKKEYESLQKTRDNEILARLTSAPVTQTGGAD